MKHLIPYLQDDQKAADSLRQLRWPNGVTCPRCGSAAVESRERCDNGPQHFNCVHCAARLGQQFAMFTDWTSSIFEESKLRPLEWLLVIGLWQLKLNATDIAAAADIQERTAQRCINLLDGGIYETYHLDPTRQLEHQVEADECYQSAGSTGLAREVERCDRAPRQRGIELRGRATAEMGRPPLLGLVQRRDTADQDAPAAPVYLERIRISFLCCPCVPLSRDQGGAQGSEGKQVDPSGRVWYSHLPWHITDSGSTKTPSSRSSAITGGPSSSAIRATRIATCRPLSTKCSAVAP